MRLLSALCLSALLLTAAPAYADRVMEVQGVHVEQKGGSGGTGGRDAAVLDATKQAAAQVWSRTGHTTPLPALTPEQLQTLSTFVDVNNESAQANYYAATFNVGIRVNALLRLAGAEAEPEADTITDDSAATMGQGEPHSAATAPSDDAPRWVLIVPAHETPAGLTLWKMDDAWASAWQRAGGALTTATASGDEKDKAILTTANLQDYATPLTDALNRLAKKYNAPAVALVVLHASNEPIKGGDELKLDITYLERDTDMPLTTDGTVFIHGAAATADPMPAAIREAQNLITQLTTGQTAQPATAPLAASGFLTPPAASTTMPATASLATAPSATGKLWVKIPLSTPSDLTTYRSKIDSIPGARFEMTAMNRSYVEGNILYTGDQSALMSALAAKGLGQQH